MVVVWGDSGAIGDGEDSGGPIAKGGGVVVAVGGAIAGASAVAGGRLLGKAGKVACEHGADLRQQNDLYFLLRLEEESVD